ncbi:MAG: MFS transporter [Daejeonella sp.]
MRSVALASTEGKWVMASSILASSMAFIDSTALNVVLPSLQESLNARGTDLFWILNSYLLMLASLILLGGALGDKFGRKRIFIIGILIFMGGSATCGFAPTVKLLIIFRALQGIGGALMIPGSLSLISSTFSDKERGKAIGTWSAATTMVTMGGPILGGALADAGLWRYIFFINVPLGIISVLILWLKVQETKDEESIKGVDFPGAITTVVGLALLTFGFLRIPEIGIASPQVYLSLIAGTILMVAFIFLEKNRKNAMMPISIFQNANFSGANLLTFFLYAGLSGGILFITLNMIQIQGYTQLQAGLTLLPFTILMVLLARLAGKLSDKYGPKWFLVSGPALAGSGLLLLAFIKQTNGPSDYWVSFFPGILIFGLGMSLTVAPLTSTVMGSAANHFSGIASGVNNAVTRISGVFANAIFGALAILIFTTFMERAIEKLPIEKEAKNAVLAESINLGNAEIPQGINVKYKQQLNSFYKEGFISAYKIILILCSVMAFSASVCAFLMISNKVTGKTNPQNTGINKSG